MSDTEFAEKFAAIWGIRERRLEEPNENPYIQEMVSGMMDFLDKTYPEATVKQKAGVCSIVVDHYVKCVMAAEFEKEVE